MSISVNVGNLIPTEVVEVGNEISVNQLAAITAATDPSATNPFSTAGHTHVIANVTGLQTALDAKANTSHTHPTSSIVNLDSILANKANITHGHGIGDINLLAETLAGKAPLAHTHVIADTTGLQTALDGKSATTHLHTGVYAPITHSHAISDTTGLQTALDGKSATTHLHTGVYAPITHTHAIADTTGLQTALDGKSATTHLHTGVYAPVTHSHAISDVTGLQTALNDKFAKSGGALNTSSVITIADGTNDSEMGAWGFGVELTADTTKNAYLSYNYVGVSSGTGFSSYSITADTGTSFSGFTTNWFEYDMGRRITLNKNGLTWDVTKTFNWGPSTGFTFNDKVTIPSPTVDNPTFNIGSISTTANLTNSVAGDVWIGTWQMAYKTANGTLVYGAATNAQNVFGSPQIIDTTNNTYPALRVTQKGTAHALVVEDSTTPDTSSFIVNNDGRVYVNYNPATTTDTVADFRVTKKAGSSYAAFFDSQGVNDGGATVQISNAGSGSPLICSGGVTRLYGGVQVGSTGVLIERINVGFSAPTPATYPYEFEIRMNGNTFRIPCRII